jgi:hypothetical protein
MTSKLHKNNNKLSSAKNILLSLIFPQLFIFLNENKIHLSFSSFKEERKYFSKLLMPFPIISDGIFVFVLVYFNVLRNKN